MMRVVLKKPGQPMRVTEIEGDLQSFYDAIECRSIETLIIGDDDKLIMVMDEEGKIRDKPHNFIIVDPQMPWRIQDVIVGTVIFCSLSEDGSEFVSVTDEHIEALQEWLKGV